MTTENLPIACTLPDEQLVGRRKEIDGNITGGVESATELPDGYEFHFSNSEEWIGKLTTFVKQERQCCRFLTFELIFQPDEGPISMRLRGPDGAKEFIKSMI
jgi:hypothetical protein